MKLRVLILGTLATDKATGLEGTLTHWIVNMGQHVDYLLQPKGLDDMGRPMHKIRLEAERLMVTKEQFTEVEIPFEILGTIVTNKASGFTGMATAFIRHINGCFHITVQPAGLLEKTRSPFTQAEFDLRECEGEMIPKLTNEELATSKADRPSPADGEFGKSIPSSADLNPH